MCTRRAQHHQHPAIHGVSYWERCAHMHATPGWASNLVQTVEKCGERYAHAHRGVRILPSALVGVGVIL